MEAAPTEKSVRFDEVFCIERVEVDVAVTGVKTLFDKLSQLLSEGHGCKTEKKRIFRVLMERERLGSTCIGKGIALPHGRLNDLPSPVGAIVQLRKPIKFGDNDDESVSLACGLMVPGDCAKVHLNLVGRLAESFDNNDLHFRLINAKSGNSLLHELCESDPLQAAG